MSESRSAFLNYVDKDGYEGDAAIHEGILDNDDASLTFHLLVIRDAIAEGDTMDSAVAVYGTELIRKAKAEGRLQEMLDRL